MNNEKEIKIIRGTTIVCFLFGVLGVAFAILAGSKSMMLDGLYSLSQSLFILLSSFIVSLIGRKEDEKYNFGYTAFEPFFIIIRTVMLLVLNLSLAWSSVLSIIDGGYRVEASYGLVFTALSIFGCSIVYVVLIKGARKFKSPILKAEGRSWINDALLSVAVLLSFLLMYIFDKIGLAYIASYIDPSLTIIFVLTLLPVLFKQMLSSLSQLLGRSPSKDVKEKMSQIIKKYSKEYSISSFKIYSISQGRSISSVIHVTVKEDIGIRRADEARGLILKDIVSLFRWADTDIVFTLDPSWFRYSIPEAQALSLSARSAQ